MDAYFSKVKKGDKVFGLVFGPGEVSRVWEADSYYTFEVEFSNGYKVPYTNDGTPGWSLNVDSQTLFYKNDIDLMDMDFSPAEKVLSVKKIIKLRDKHNLEVRCPSGLWQKVNECPYKFVEEYLEKGKLFLFRKAK